ncbi:putative trafficking protein particle complex subunit TRS31 [Dictyocoela muelleri]|nr:putative trafficking protein particle complex subunit TRS31 [Dictyocoela muelleri]
MKSISLASSLSLNSSLTEIYQENPQKLIEIGKEIGLRLLEYFKLNQELNISNVLFNIKYMFNKIKKSKREIEKCIEKENTYLFIDYVPIFGNEYLTIGIIEISLLASGFKTKIECCNSSCQEYLSKFVYIVEVE